MVAQQAENKKVINISADEIQWDEISRKMTATGNAKVYNENFSVEEADTIIIDYSKNELYAWGDAKVSSKGGSFQLMKRPLKRRITYNWENNSTIVE